MEDYDDLRDQGPDAGGLVDLSHHAWVTLDEEVWGWGDKLLLLNVSFNRIREISPLVGRLGALRELDLGHNAISCIPDAIGDCARLKILRASHNDLTTLPGTIGQCKLLEELHLSNNAITHLPPQVGGLAVLHSLLVQDNALSELAPELAQCLSLETIDLSNNRAIANIPQEVLTDTKIVLWLCRRNLMHKQLLDELEQTNHDLEQQAESDEHKRATLNTQLQETQQHLNQLLKERPETFLKMAAHATNLKSRLCAIQ